MKITSKNIMMVVIIIVASSLISFLINRLFSEMFITKHTAISVFGVPTPIPMSSGTKPADATSLLSLTQLSPLQVAVTLDTKGKPVSGVQLNLSYNPQVLTNVTIAPSTTMVSALVLANHIDRANGTIFYVLTVPANNQPVLGKQTVAIISYTPVPGVADHTTINFLPSTKVVSAGITQSVLDQATGITIPISSQ